MFSGEWIQREPHDPMKKIFAGKAVLTWFPGKKAWSVDRMGTAKRERREFYEEEADWRP
jgi:hypothetical protein